MRVVFGLVLVLGIGLAGFAVYMVRGYVNSYQVALAKERASQPKAVPTVEVYVAKEPLTYGQKITADQVRAVAWPKAAMPEGIFTVEEAGLFPNGIEHRFVLRAMEKDEPVLAVKVTEPGEDAGLTSRLDRGMRAFTIKVDASTGVSGFLRPGDRVDVYWTGRISQQGERHEVTRLIQNAIKLIAVDQTANGDTAEATIASTVTVAASPQQVAALAQAQSTGELTLALVGIEDDTEIGIVAVDQQSLLGLTPIEKQAQIQPEKVCTIRTRRGAEVVEIPIPCTN